MNTIERTELPSRPRLQTPSPTRGLRGTLCNRDQRRHWILGAIPLLGEPVLDALIGQVFADDRLCEAYLQVMGSSDDWPQPVLAIDLSLQGVWHALESPRLMRHERAMAAWIALLEDCGLYLYQLERHGRQADESAPTQNDLEQLRNDALYPVLRQLRQRLPRQGAAVCAVMGAEEYDDESLDEQQIARIRSALRHGVALHG